VLALGVDTYSGGLVIRNSEDVTGERTIHSGEIHHVRLAGRAATSVGV